MGAERSRETPGEPIEDKRSERRMQIAELQKRGTSVLPAKVPMHGSHDS